MKERMVPVVLEARVWKAIAGELALSVYTRPLVAPLTTFEGTCLEEEGAVVAKIADVLENVSGDVVPVTVWLTAYECSIAGCGVPASEITRECLDHAVKVIERQQEAVQLAEAV